jgi:hypothetical protein
MIGEEMVVAKFETSQIFLEENHEITYNSR